MPNCVVNRLVEKVCWGQGPRPCSAGDGPVRGGGDELAVLREYAGGVLRRQRLPAVLARLPVLPHLDLEGPVEHVEGDLVAVAQERDRSPVDRLGGDVADAEPRGAPGEAAVGDQEDVLAEPRAL